MNARDILSEPELHVQLVDSRRLETYIEPSQIEPENSRLAGLLIGDGHIHDSADWFDLVATSSWPIREFAISKSFNISTFITPALVPPDDVQALMRSEIIKNEVKIAILQQIDTFVPSDDRNALQAIALFANENRAVVLFGTSSGSHGVEFTRNW